VRGKGTKLVEGIRDFYIQDFYADLWFDLGFLHLRFLCSGLFCSGKVRGATDSDKHSSLLRYRINYSRKILNSTGLRV
jgi:hypothetical protein